MMKNFKFLVILMCLSLCFGGTAYAAQAQRTNGDDDVEVNLDPYIPPKTPERSETILKAIGHVYHNPLRLVLSLPEKLGETMVTVKDAQTDIVLGTAMVNTIQESIVTLGFEQGTGHFVLTIESAEYAGEGEFSL